MTAPKLSISEIRLYERPVRLRLPFRFGIVTLTEAPQAFVRCRIRLADGREQWGMSAELMVPKWFDKNPSLSNEANFDQLRASCAIAVPQARTTIGVRQCCRVIRSAPST